MIRNDSNITAVGQVEEMWAALRRAAYLASNMDIRILLDAVPYDEEDAKTDWLYTRRKYTARQRTAQRNLKHIEEVLHYAEYYDVPSIGKAAVDIDDKAGV